MVAITNRRGKVNTPLFCDRYDVGISVLSVHSSLYRYLPYTYTSTSEDDMSQSVGCQRCH